MRRGADAGIEAANARYLEHGTYAFLEIERFDRVGRFGRRGMISAGALDDECFGMRDNWPAFAQRCETAGMLGPDSVRRILVLTAFSELIGNGDRHFENLSLMTDEAFEAAHAFWTRAAADRRLSRGMREISGGNARQIAEVVAPLLPAGAQR